MGVGDAGSPQFPFLAPEIALLRKLLARDAPVLGICLGSQLLAAAAGARVYPNTRPGPDGKPSPRARSAGARRSSRRRREPALAGPARATAGRCTGTATPTICRPGAVHLASTPVCRHQAFRIGARVRPAVPLRARARDDRGLGARGRRLRARRARPGGRRAHPRRHRSPLRRPRARSGIACSATSSRSCNSRRTVAAPNTFKIGLVQMRCSTDPDDNLDARVRALARGGRPRRARSSACPSCSARQYFCQTEDHANFDLAEPIPGPDDRGAGRGRARDEAWSIVGSLFERRAAGVYHNTAVVIDADGELLGSYRKMHIPDDPLYYEKFYFTPGDLGFRAFDTALRPRRHAGLLGSVVSRGRAADGARGRGRAVLPDGDRLAPVREGRVRRGAGRRLGDHAARARDRQRRLRRGGQPRRPREAGRRRRRHRVLGRLVRRRSVRPGARRGVARPRRRSLIVTCDRRAPGDGPPQLAVPARPPDRRLRRDHPPVHRRMKRRPESDAAAKAPDPPPAALGFRMPAEWEPHAATWIAWPHKRERLAGQVRADPLGLRRDRPPPAPSASASASWCRRPRRRSARAPMLRARRRRPRARRSSSAAPTDRVWTRDYVPDSSSRDRRPARSPSTDWRFNGWAKYDEPQARRRRQRPHRPPRLGCGSWEPTAPIGRRAGARRARRRRHRRQRPRDAADDRGVPARREVQARNPGLGREALERGASRDYLGVRKVLWLGRGHRRRRHARPRRRPGALRRPETRSSSRRRATPTTPTTSRCARTARACERHDRPGRAAAARCCRCRCRRRSSSTACGCRPATRTSTSPTGRSWCRRSTTRTTAWRSRSWRRCSRPRGGRHPRRRSGLGLRHAPLPDAAATGGRRVAAIARFARGRQRSLRRRGERPRDPLAAAPQLHHHGHDRHDHDRDQDAVLGVRRRIFMTLSICSPKK